MIAPGPWAIHIRKLPFRAARQGDILQGEYLGALHGMSNQREPCLGHGVDWTARQFQQQMNDSLPRVEAAVMQVVGQQNEPQCTMCQRQFGTFSHCVSVRGINGLSACAICHWAQQDALCQYATFAPSAARPGDGGTLGRLPNLPHQRYGIIRHMQESFWLAGKHMDLTDELMVVWERSQSLEAQLRALQPGQTDANTAITTNGKPMEQTLHDIRASQQELRLGIVRCTMLAKEIYGPYPDLRPPL